MEDANCTHKHTINIPWIVVQVIAHLTMPPKRSSVALPIPSLRSCFLLSQELGNYMWKQNFHFAPGMGELRANRNSVAVLPEASAMEKQEELPKST